MPDIKKVIKRTPTEKQTLFFSATMPEPIKELAKSIQKDPEIIKVKSTTPTTDTINQKVYYVKLSHKRKLLQQIVKRRDLESIIVFVKTKEDTEYVMDYVKSANIKCNNIHKFKSQN
jgi:ATP-dependent RNA helicase RhlE